MQEDKGKQKVRRKVVVLALNFWDLSENRNAHRCPSRTLLWTTGENSMKRVNMSVSRGDIRFKRKGSKIKLRLRSVWLDREEELKKTAQRITVYKRNMTEGRLRI